MKKVKKILAVLLTAAMILGMNLSVLATEPAPQATTGSITIENYLSGQTYTFYKMFDLESSQGAAYSYKVVSGWEDFVKNESIARECLELYGIDDMYVRIKNNVGEGEGYSPMQLSESQKAALAEAAVTYAENNKIPATATITTNEEANSNVVSGLELGYYVMSSNVGAICSLTTTNPNATIEEKNDQPKIDKKVWEDLNEDGNKDDNEWVSINDEETGEYVYFKTTIDAQPGAHGYVLHDRMSPGLTLDKDSIKVFLGDNELENGVKIFEHDHTKGKEYYDEQHESKPYYIMFDHESHEQSTEVCDFEIHFMETLLDTITTATKIEVTYRAKLNRDAAIFESDNINATKLQYGEDNYTEIIKTSTYTYMLEVFKTDSNNNIINDAVFNLYREVPEETDGAVELTLNADGAKAYGELIKLASNGDLTYSLTELDANAAVYDFTAGEVEIKGFDVGTYYLVEKTAPTGYNKMEYPKEIVFERDQYFKSNNKMGTSVDKIYQEGSGGIQVINNTGTLLPETGGTGRTILYTAGSIFTVAAIVIIVTKKRMRHEK